MNRNTVFLIVFALLSFGVITRMLPHLPNATPLTAIAFASSLYLDKRWSVVLPIATLFLSDVTIGFYDWKIMASVYGSFVLIGLCSWIIKKYPAPLTVGIVVVSSSILFFLVTNFAVWLFSPWYVKSIAGLLYSYELGIPFLRNMLIGDVLYTTGLVAFFETVRAVTFILSLPPELGRGRVRAGFAGEVRGSSQ